MRHSWGTASTNPTNINQLYSRFNLIYSASLKYTRFHPTQYPTLQHDRPTNRASKDPQVNGTKSGLPTTKEALSPRGTSYDRATNGTKYHHLHRLSRLPILAARLEVEPEKAATVLPILIRQQRSTKTRNSGTNARLMKLNLEQWWRLKGAEPLDPETNTFRVDHKHLPL